MTSLNQELAEFNELCRVCANKTNILLALNIFEGDGSNRAIYKKINKCLPIKVNMEDKLPKLICEECVYKLDLLNEFQDISSKTEMFLTDLLNRIFVSAEHNTHTLMDVSCSGPVAINMSQVLEGRDKLHDSPCMDSNELTSLDSPLGSSQLADSIDLKTDSNDKVESIIINGSTYIVTSEPLEGATFYFCVLCSKTFGDRNAFDTHCADTHWNKCEPCGLLFTSQEAYNVHCTDIHSLDKLPSSTPQDVSYILSHMESYRSLPQQSIPLAPVLSNGSLVGALANGISNGISMGSSILSDGDGMCSRGNDLPDRNPLASSSLPNGLGSTSTLNEDTLVSGSIAPSSGMPGSPSSSADTLSVRSNTLASVSSRRTSLASPSRSSVTGSSLSNGMEVLDPSSGVMMQGGEAETLRSDEMSAVKGEEDGVSCDEMHDDESVSDMKCGLPDEANEKEELADGKPKQRPLHKCPHCSKKFSSPAKFNFHVANHGVEKPFQCFKCEKRFRSKIGLDQHEAKHTGRYEYECDACGKGFQCKSYLIVHQRVHSTEKPYQCGTCACSFKTKASLRDHENRHLGVKPYSCEICGRGFITKGLCKSHQKIHTGGDNRQYPCPVCNKMFVSKSYLNTHVRIHTGDKPFICEHCNKGFLTKIDLKIHNTMHTGEKSFVCETCGKAFARRDALRCHTRSHTGERPYRCNICGQSFTQFSPMAIHKRLHTGERPYSCDICNKAFVSRSTMLAHHKNHKKLAS